MREWGGGWEWVSYLMLSPIGLLDVEVSLKPSKVILFECASTKVDEDNVDTSSSMESSSQCIQALEA